MNKREAERRTRMNDTLRALGFTREDCEALRRISMTLHRWHELECGDGTHSIERDETTGKPYMRTQYQSASGWKDTRYAVADREAGALKRLAAIIDRRNGWIDNPHSKDAEEFIHAACNARLAGKVTAYVQGDPRGAALYIIRPQDVPRGEDVSAYYSRGLCVY